MRRVIAGAVRIGEKTLEEIDMEEYKANPDAVIPAFTPAEATLILSLIKTGWSHSVVGSRLGYELLASVEDKIIEAGGVEAAETRPN